MSPEEGTPGGRDGTTPTTSARSHVPRDMEIWVPKLGKDFSKESIEEVWEAWRNDVSKDECKVQLDGPEEAWWAGTEMGLLRAYRFDGHITASDGSVGTGTAGF